MGLAFSPFPAILPIPAPMATQVIQPLNGFRDFYPEDFARREYIFSTWRRVAHSFGFLEYEGPVLESLDLYRKKSGGELLGQLFSFTDKGEREVTLRPEMTPTLARMVAAGARRYKKPIKWFSIGSFFRYEKPQRGRLREFSQLNVDIFGEPGLGADAELISLAVAITRAFGFSSEEVKVRLSNRDLWAHFLKQQEKPASHLEPLLPIIDKFDFHDPARTPEALLKTLAELDLTPDSIQAFVENPDLTGTPLAELREELIAAGCGDYVEIDPRIVRGLAYYTGTVFELFDAKASMRALAGGGRYDNLVSLLSDGAVDLPAIGMGCGDVTLGDLIESTPNAKARRDATLAAHRPVDVFVVIADPTRRAEALNLLGRLRKVGVGATVPLAPAKVGKQFQAAEEQGARFAVVVGSEWPTVKVKTLEDRSESSVDEVTLLPYLQGRGVRFEDFNP